MREIPTLTKTRKYVSQGHPCRERADRSRDDRRYLMRRRWPQAAWPRVRVAVGREQSSFSAVPLVSNVHSYRILLNLESDM